MGLTRPGPVRGSARKDSGAVIPHGAAGYSFWGDPSDLHIQQIGGQALAVHIHGQGAGHAHVPMSGFRGSIVL